MSNLRIGSLARITDLMEVPYDIEVTAQRDWRTGDYVAGRVTGTPTALYQIESCSGEMLPVEPGDRVIGALGVRAATLEGVGSWRNVRHGKMQTLTGAGVIGAFTSLSSLLPAPIQLDYLGHVRRLGKAVRMSDFALQCTSHRYSVPTILIVGTSMSAGKTVTGQLICRILAAAGLKLIGAKLTGAGRYRDILSFRNAGASEVYDFVDAGLPSTIASEDVFLAAIRPLLCHIASRKPDYVVVEAGASPLEPYNGAAMVEELKSHICCSILCASDPYAVVGVEQAFQFQPDLVCGPATSTSAAIALVNKLSGHAAINVLASDARDTMRQFLEARLQKSLEPIDIKKT